MCIIDREAILELLLEFSLLLIKLGSLREDRLDRAVFGQELGIHSCLLDLHVLFGANEILSDLGSKSWIDLVNITFD